jgi:hypothetical protein
MDKKHNQKFRWYWNDTQYNTASLGAPGGKGHDAAFRFGVKYIHTQPGIHGEIRSDLASVLFEYKTLKIARTATETVVFHQAEPQHIIEHHPPKINQGDDNLVTLESFGEAITGEIQHMQESIRSEQICIRSDALEQSIMQSIRRNRGVAAMFGKSDTLYSESDAERKRRELSNGLDKAVTLKPDFSYKAAQMPKLSVKLEELEAR